MAPDPADKVSPRPDPPRPQRAFRIPIPNPAAARLSPNPAATAAKIHEARPYAELWMGTHPAAPSVVLPGGEPLGAWLARNPAVAARWAGYLPFLFKVLSVAKPLSIQAHPDKGLVELLHAMRPATYRDANHKPEMAIAVTDIEV